MALTGDSNARIQRAATPAAKPAPAPKPATARPATPTGAIRHTEEDARNIAAAKAKRAAAALNPPAPSKPSTPSKPAAPAVDDGAQERAAQEARERAAREAAERRAAKIEAERLDALRRAEEERIAAIVAARPTVPKYLASTSVQSVKYASPADVLIQESSLPIDLILKQTLEKIGGLELISLVRHDTVNGQDIVYQPVKNLSQIEVMYNSQNMVKIPDSSEIYFKNFAIKLEASIPQYDPDMIYADMIDRDNNVLFDAVNNRIVIELVNLKPDYEVEVQTVSLGKVFNDTIYDEDES
jgi:hypothetical protein